MQFGCSVISGWGLTESMIIDPKANSMSRKIET